jgi:hypothetical protein
MAHVDDLIEPSPKQIVLPALRRSFGRIESTPSPAHQHEGITARSVAQFAR